MGREDQKNSNIASTWYEKICTAGRYDIFVFIHVDRLHGLQMILSPGSDFQKRGGVVRRLLVVIVTAMLCLAMAGCELEVSSGGGDDSGGNATVRVDSLQSYTRINHAFLSNSLSALRDTTNLKRRLTLVRTDLEGEASAVIKVLGKIAQMAKKVKTKQDKENFEDEVLSDLKDIKEELDDLDKKVTEGFAEIMSKLDECEFHTAWNALSTPYLVKIDTVWDYYLNDAGTGMVDKLAGMESDDITYEDVRADVTAFIGHIEDYENDLQEALTAIRDYMSGTGAGGYSKLLSLFGDYLASNNGNAFTDPDVMDSVISQYLYLYADLVTYQMKATILLDEYYNYQLQSDDIVLNEDGYSTVMSDDAKDQNAELLADLKKGLGEFLNNGERLISQFNAGDIYRNFASTTTAIRNSDYYPFIDSYIQIFYGYTNVFVFRLAWSEEATNNDPDAWFEGKEVTGEYGYNYNYESLFEGLGNSADTLEFFLEKEGVLYADPVTDKNHADNLTTISTFGLHPRGATDKEFQAGVRRYVFVNLTEDRDLLLNYVTDLQEDYEFKYSYGDFPYHNGDVYTKTFKLYDPENIQFTIGGLLSDNNPLASQTFDTTCVSYTFGAYLTEFEYLAGANTLFDSASTYEAQIRSLYGPFNYIEYRVESSGNQHIEIADKQKCGFTVVPDGNDTSTPIHDGQQVVVYMMYDYNDKSHHGYMYQPKTKSEKPVKFKEGMDNAIRFNIEKKYIFPSGKLFSNDEIKQFNWFMLTKGDLCVHSMSDDHDNRLEFYDNNPFSMNNWFFLDSEIPWWYSY